jgi:hypothetical protein
MCGNEQDGPDKELAQKERTLTTILFTSDIA